MAKGKNIYQEFLLEFKKAHTEVWKNYTNVGSGEKVPISDLIDSLVEASYQNLVDSVMSRLILLGRVSNTKDQTPASRIKSREMATVQILMQMGLDLQMLDTKHEYSVSIVKRERKTTKT